VQEVEDKGNNKAQGVEAMGKGKVQEVEATGKGHVVDAKDKVKAIEVEDDDWGDDELFFDFNRVVNLYNELVSWTLSIISFM
jgi:hypothetical protein